MKKNIITVNTPRTKSVAERVNRILAVAMEKGDNDGFTIAVKDSMLVLLKNSEQLEVDLVVLMGSIQKLLSIQTPAEAQAAMVGIHSVINSINSRGQAPQNPRKK